MSMAEPNTQQIPSPPSREVRDIQDIDDLIFSGQTDQFVSQR